MPGWKCPQLIRMPLARRQAIADDLKIILGEKGVIADRAGMSVYESDALAGYRQAPLVVALPANTAQVAETLKYCHDNHVKIVPRGAGTSLSGGALPLADGILLGLGRMNAILDIDFENRTVVAQPGGDQPFDHGGCSA